MAVGDYPLPNFEAIAGVKLGIASAGVKTEGRKDLVVIELCAGGQLAGVFTRNAFCAAPVHVCRDHLLKSDESSKRVLVINTGNANAGTGTQGDEDAEATVACVAELFGIAPEAAFPFSTGVIGEKLPVEKIISALPMAKKGLDEANWSEAAEGIMTTDTRPKGATRVIRIGGEEIRISGISKGAGMIKPNMATMLGFVATDAKLSAALCQKLLSEIAEQSFNRITVDGDTSTNDSCMLMASGKSSAPELSEEHPEFAIFKDALKSLFVEIAQLIVRDGEGATKFISVQVEQGASTQESLEAAYTIAHSPLVKTALFACDPNWGRILAALGRANLADLDLSKINIYLDEVCIVEAGGVSPDYTEEAGQSVMNRSDITIRVQLGRGSVEETVWTTDLSHEYVTINAEYRT